VDSDDKLDDHPCGYRQSTVDTCFARHVNDERLSKDGFADKYHVEIVCGRYLCVWKGIIDLLIREQQVTHGQS
jgi:hypothetical protein